MSHANRLNELLELTSLFEHVVVFVVSRLVLAICRRRRESSLAFFDKSPAVDIAVRLMLYWVGWVPSKLLRKVVLVWSGSVVGFLLRPILSKIVLRNLLKHLVLAEDRNLLELGLVLNEACKFRASEISCTRVWLRALERHELGSRVNLLGNVLGLGIGFELSIFYLKKLMSWYKANSLCR